MPVVNSVRTWFDNQAFDATTPDTGTGIDWVRTLPFVILHVAVFSVIWVGVSALAVLIAIALYAIRMFAITAFYHRYFSHRAFKTSRIAQFLFALLGATAVQRGPLWWASHHRHHHLNSDQPGDAHSPKEHGFLWSHMGWFLARENFPTKTHLIPDLIRFPELRFLDRFDVLMPVLLASGLFLFGNWLSTHHPQLNTNGSQMLVWGFVVSTVMLYHSTFLINSLAHRVGKRRYATKDNSRNNWWLAILTFGEGWHNNHHRYPGAARQGFKWYELDLSYIGLRLLAACGVIWGLKSVPENIRNARIDERLSVAAITAMDTVK